MARPQKVSDAQLREAQRIFAGEPDATSRIAAYLRLSEKQVRNRLDAMEKQVAAPRAIKAVEAVEANVWDVRAELQKNFERVGRMIESIEENGVYERTDKGEAYWADGVMKLTALYRENRAHLEVALKAAEAWYRIEETKAFMDDVMGVLAEVDPGLRQRVMERIRSRRSVRAAFVP